MILSVIIPVYNSEFTITKSIEAIASQDFTDYEVFLVNDGSTDNSKSICEKFSRDNSKIKVINQINMGAGPARNAGLNQATGEFVMFLDADDNFGSKTFSTLVENIQSTASDCVISGYNEIVDGKISTVRKFEPRIYEGEEIRSFVSEEFPNGIVGYCWNKIYRRSTIADNGIQFSDMRRYQDGVFNLDFFSHSSKTCIISDVLYNYEVNTIDGLFSKMQPTIFKYIDLLHNAYLRYLDDNAIDFNTKVISNASNAYFNDLVGAFDCFKNPIWEYDRQKSIDTMVTIQENEVYQFYLENFDLSNLSNSYVRLVQKAISNKKFSKAYSLISVKVTFKRRFYGVFKYLKGLLK